MAERLGRAIQTLSRVGLTDMGHSPQRIKSVAAIFITRESRKEGRSRFLSGEFLFLGIKRELKRNTKRKERPKVA